MPQKGFTTTLTMKLEADIVNLKKGLAAARKKTKKFSNGMQDLGKVIAGAFAVSAVKNFIKEALKAFNIQDKAERSLLVSLKGRRDITDRLISQARELQKETLFGDEETIKAQSLIAAFVKEEAQIKRIIPLVQDLATAKGMDLAAAADLVSKTLGSSTNALSRYGIAVEGAVGSTERLESLASGLINAFEGQARAAAEAGTGGLTQLSNIYGDLMETIGGVLAPSKLWIKSLQDIVISVDDLLKQPLSAKYEEERVGLNLLVRSITSANTTNKSRVRLIKELQDKYPDFIGNIDAETISNDELEKALIKVNEQLKQKILIQLKSEAISDLLKRQARLLIEEDTLIKKLTKTQIDLTKAQKGSSRSVDILVMAQFNENNQLENNRSAYQKLEAEIKKVNDIYDKLIGKITTVSKTETPAAPGGGKGKGGGEDTNFNPLTFFGIPSISVIDDAGTVINESIRGSLEERALIMAEFENKRNILLEQAKERALAVTTAVQNAFAGMGNSIISGFGEASNSFERFIKGLAETAIKLISMMLATSIANSIAGATASGTATGPAAIFTTPAFIATAVAGVLGAFAAIPKFASGGVASGLTMVGERGKELVNLPQGSRVLSHPDTMKAIGGGGTIVIISDVKIKGEDIWLSFTEANRKLGNTRG